MMGEHRPSQCRMVQVNVKGRWKPAVVIDPRDHNRVDVEIFGMPEGERLAYDVPPENATEADKPYWRWPPRE